MARIEIRLLGAFETSREGELVNSFESIKVRALLAYLAAAPDRPQRRDFLAEMFWPERPAGVARTDLRNALRNLRSVLNESARSGPGQQGMSILTATRDSLQLNACDDVWLDASVFCQTLDALKDPTQAPTVDLAKLVDLYRGPFLDDIYIDECREFQEWAMLKREYYQSLMLRFLGRLVRYYELLGDLDLALKYAWRQVELARWDERAHRQLMRILALQGNRTAALKHYDACTALLWEEMGVTPARETLALYEQIRDGSLAASTAKRPITYQTPQLFRTNSDAALEKPPFFVARESELAKLDRILTETLSGVVQVAFVTGDAGTGKTAILAAFARRALARDPNLLVATGQCTAISGVGDPYHPMRQIVSMLLGDAAAARRSGIVDRAGRRRLSAAAPTVLSSVIGKGERLIEALVSWEMIWHQVCGLGPEWLECLERLAAIQEDGQRENGQQAHRRLFEEVTAVLQDVAREHPLLLIIDDLQWVDGATASLLFHLSRRLRNSPILIAAAYRPEEVVADANGRQHPLTPLLGEFRRRFGDTWIDLNPREEARDRRLLNALLDAHANRLGSEFRDTLYRRTKGQPLFTLEILRDMEERGAIVAREGVWIAQRPLSWERLPVRVEAVIEQRVKRLSPALQDVLTSASVQGEQFYLPLLAAAAGQTESACQVLLSEAERAYGLVSERGDVQLGQRLMSSYQFSHILVRDYLYSRLSVARRRLQHQQVAVALERLCAGDEEAVARLLAYHYRLANMTRQALPYVRMAAQSARRSFAYEEAVELYSRALDIARALGAAADLMGNLYRERGLVHELSGDFASALADQEAALATADQAGDAHLTWRARVDLGKLWAAQDYERAGKHWRRSLELAKVADDPLWLAESLNWVGNWYLNHEQPGQAVAYHRHALAIFEKEGSVSDIAMTLDLLGIALQIGGDFIEAADAYDRGISLYRQLDDARGLAAVLTGRGNLAGAGGNTETLAPAVPLGEGERSLQEALRLARAGKMPVAETWASWALGLLYMAAGEFGQALQHVEGSLALAESLGHKEWTVGNMYAVGHVHRCLNSLQKAEAILSEGLALATDLHSQHWVNVISGQLAELKLTQEDVQSAREVLQPVLKPATPMDSLSKRACWASWGRLALLDGEPAEALDIAQRLIATLPVSSVGRVVPALWALQGEALADLGQLEKARLRLREAIHTAEAWGYLPLGLKLLTTAARIWRQAGSASEADDALARAHGLGLQLAQTIPSGPLQEGFLSHSQRELQRAMAE